MADGSPLQEPRRKQMQRRFGQLKNERSQYEPYWQELADYLLPSQTRYILSGGEVGSRNKNPRRNTKSVRNTPFRALDTFVAGMMSGTASPARPWFRLTTPDPSLAEYGPVKAWLYTVESRMREIFSKSNLYSVLPVVFRDQGVFGVASMLAFEDSEDIMRFYPQAAGTYWLSQSARLVVDTMYRRYQMTVRQLVQEFGVDVCSARVQAMAKNGQWEQWIDVLHCIEPNDERLMGAFGPRGMEYRSVYSELGGDDDKLLGTRGFNESPLMAPRWDVSPEDIYASSSPGMVALGPCKALSVQERRKAQAIDKLVNPPLMAPTGLRNALIDNVAGGITYFDANQAVQGVRSLYDTRPDIGALVNDIKETSAEIYEAFFTDLFLAISSMEGVQPRNQFEIFERKEEKLLMLGPALERQRNELLDPLINRAFSIMVRRSQPYWSGALDGEGLLPAPPEELQGSDLKVEYISILAQAQKSIGVSTVDRVIAFTGALATQKQDPSVWDKIDSDQSIDEYGEMLGLSPRIIRSDEQVAAIRQQRATAQAQQQALQSAAAMKDITGAARDLSETQMGGDTAMSRIAGALSGQ